jgi:replicative DNA helicase
MPIRGKAVAVLRAANGNGPHHAFVERRPASSSNIHNDQSEERYWNHLANRQAACNEVRGVAEIIIGKDRHGPGGTVKVHWDAERMRFENPAKGQP